jgi:hypothetical protein
VERSDSPRADPRQKAQRNWKQKAYRKASLHFFDGKRIEISLAIALKFKASK